MSKKKGVIFISCEEAASICDKSQYNEATLWQKIKLNIHILSCRFCKKYVKNNTHLTHLCSKAQLHSLQPEQKEEMKKVIDSEISK
ncbi:hypothetical protein [Abyssalbus ytuae]|uniref:Glycine dehydrogenase n=1 Tax=Abyssalbus ytuae TaxID=2926907 RepID=A0A9E6ZW60_9FLAO|nr:hypothetical protein [Abyssalbus ytuae]UOB16327.1 hypothetical protein MQE35_11320 [Abyssalbus ytuae]